MTTATLTSRTSATGGGISRAKLTLLVVAGLATSYAVYARTVTPFVQPPSVDVPGQIVEAAGGKGAPRYNLLQAQKYLKHAPWAGDAKYQMRTDANTIVYAEEWQKVDDDRAIRFKQFAMIWNQKGRKEDEPPITVVADSAYVRFERKFDVGKPNPGRVIAGSLEGKVDIRGPNGLQILGRDFRFSEKSMSLWSDQPLTFAYASHRGKAKGMQCDLLPHPADKPPKPGELNVAGFRNIRLTRDVAMNFLFRGAADRKLLGFGNKKQKQQVAGAGALRSPGAPGLPDGPAPATRKDKTPKKPTRVQVRAAGSFLFDLETNIATFEEDVRVYRPTKPDKFDVLKCHLLTLLFAPDKNAEKKQPKKTKADSQRFKTIDSKLTFQRLRAQPNNLNGRVVLISEASKLTATMEDLVYSAETKVADLRDRNQVRVEQDTSLTLAKRIVLKQDKKGSVTRLDCLGAGSITHTDKKTGKVDLKATWTKRLSKYPDSKSNLDIIELVDDAILHQPKDDSTLNADLIKIWIDREKKKPKRTEVADKPRDPRDRARSRKLHRMLAKDNVRMTSPQMIANTKRLEVWFEHPPDGSSPKVAFRSAKGRVFRPTAHPAKGVTLTQVLSRSERRHSIAFASVVDDLKTSTKTDDDSNPLAFKRSKDDGPIEVWGDLIRARILQGRNKRDTQVREIWTLGNVRVEQQHKDGDDPLKLTGDRLHVVAGKTKHDHVLHVYGKSDKPAKIVDRGMAMQGGNIHLDRGQNVAWVVGKGVLHLPVNRTLDGKKLAKPQTLEVSWKKLMTFDGGITKFRGGVRSTVEDSRVRCEEMDVYLTERIQFADGKRKGKQKPQVKLVICNLGVQVESYEFTKTEPKKLIQFRKGKVKRFTVDQLNGDTLANGPGWMSVWRYGKQREGKFGRLAKVRANQSEQNKSSKPRWTYSRVDFAGTARGNLKKRYNTFLERVQVVHGPVAGPSRVINIDADDIPKGVGWMRAKKLTVTQMKKTKLRPAYMKMQADGNAEVDGQGFHARADTISYDELEDLYTLESRDGRNATIWRQEKVGGKQNRAAARRMTFVPSINKLRFKDTRSLNGFQ